MSGQPPPLWATTIVVKFPSDGKVIDLPVRFQGQHAFVDGDDTTISKNRQGYWTPVTVKNGSVSATKFDPKNQDMVALSEAVELAYQAYLAAIVAGDVDD